MTGDQIPKGVRKKFRRSVAHIAVFGMLRRYRREDQGHYHPDDLFHQSVQEWLNSHYDAVTTALEEYPDLDATTEGYNPVKLVERGLEDTRAFENNPDFKQAFAILRRSYRTSEAYIVLEPDTNERFKVRWSSEAQSGAGGQDE
jgi:hypothetical protein